MNAKLMTVYLPTLNAHTQRPIAVEVRESRTRYTATHTNSATYFGRQFDKRRAGMDFYLTERGAFRAAVEKLHIKIAYHEAAAEEFRRELEAAQDAEAQDDAARNDGSLEAEIAAERRAGFITVDAESFRSVTGACPYCARETDDCTCQQERDAIPGATTALGTKYECTNHSVWGDQPERDVERELAQDRGDDAVCEYGTLDPAHWSQISRETM